MREIKNDKYWIRQQDNLEFMKELENDSIDLIYCDILYNTNKSFADYEDKLGTPQQAIEWYRPRLIEMKRLLKQTGSIYLQCDYRLVHYLKVEMDTVFGLSNFKNDIVWHYSKMNATNNIFIQNHDNILFYSKTNKYFFTPQFTDNESALKTRLSKFIFDDKIIYKNIKNHKSQLMDNYISSAKNKLNKSELDDEDIVIDFSNKNKQKVDTVWNIFLLKGNSKEKVDYSTQKPKALLERIIKASSNEGDVVADFFMGSGTTGEVALELGRKFIGCDIGDKAFEITSNRLK